METPSVCVKLPLHTIRAIFAKSSKSRTLTKPGLPGSVRRQAPVLANFSKMLLPGIAAPEHAQSRRISTSPSGPPSSASFGLLCTSLSSCAMSAVGIYGRFARIRDHAVRREVPQADRLQKIWIATASFAAFCSAHIESRTTAINRQHAHAGTLMLYRNRTAAAASADVDDGFSGKGTPVALQHRPRPLLRTPFKRYLRRCFHLPSPARLDHI